MITHPNPAAQPDAAAPSLTPIHSAAIAGGCGVKNLNDIAELVLRDSKDRELLRAKLSDIRHRHDTQPALLAALQALTEAAGQMVAVTHFSGCKDGSTADARDNLDASRQQARKAIAAATKGAK